MSTIHRTKAWSALVRRVRPAIEAAVQSGSAVCIDCGSVISPHESWQVGHRLSASRYPEFALEEWNLGPSHGGRGRGRKCNQKAGGTMGAKVTNAKKKRKSQGGGMIEWRNNE